MFLGCYKFHELLHDNKFSMLDGASLLRGHRETWNHFNDGLIKLIMQRQIKFPISTDGFMISSKSQRIRVATGMVTCSLSSASVWKVRCLQKYSHTNNEYKFQTCLIKKILL